MEQYDIVYVRDWGRGIGSMQNFGRPAVVLQNNKGNTFSNTTIVAFITSKMKRLDIPTHVLLEGYRLWKPSMLLLEQIATVPKELITKNLDHLRPEDIKRVEQALDISLDRRKME
ncbi:MAG: type II toxin-antitoxin system PemK/MazF family toxin [Niameybacter sp.]